MRSLDGGGEAGRGARRRNHPLMTDADVEQPPGVRESRRLVTEFLGRLRMGLMDAERMGTAVGAALLGIHAEARASLVAGLVLLEEGPMLHYLQARAVPGSAAVTLSVCSCGGHPHMWVLALRRCRSRTWRSDRCRSSGATAEDSRRS